MQSLFKMPRDRLQELKALKKKECPDDVAVNIEDVEEQNDITIFFDLTKKTKENIDKLQNLISNLANSHAKMLVTIDKKEKKKIDGVVSSINDEILAVSKNIKSQLLKIENSSVNFDERIKNLQCNTLMNNYMTVIEKYNKVLDDNKKMSSEVIKRSLRIIDPDVSDETINDFIENGSDKNILFSKNVNDQHTDILNEAKARHNDILEMEKSLLVLLSIFQDMQLLVNSQDKMIGNIGDNVEKTVVKVERAVENVRIAKVYDTQIRRKKICISLCCFIIIAVIAGVIIGIKI